MKKILIFSFILALIISCSYAIEKNKKISLDEAIKIVKNEMSSPFPIKALNPSPFELQVSYRLADLAIYNKDIGYQFNKADAAAWKTLMTDKKASMYARLCAAYFLLDDDKEARQFIEEQIKSENLRYRYNAAKIVEMYMDYDSTKTWAVDLLIDQLYKGTLDGSGVKSSPTGEFPEGDRDDIMHTPIDSICRDFGYMKEKKAVPALIKALERQPENGSIAGALGDIGDTSAIPILLKLLKENKGDDLAFIGPLGDLKCNEAIPILISKFENIKEEPTPIGYGWETEVFLETFLKIGDKRAIAPIEKYLNEDHPDKIKKVARRILLQLKDEDPVKGLLALLEKETDEFEISSLIYALSNYKDNRTIEILVDISMNSEYAMLRGNAINALGRIGNRNALFALADLLRIDFPKEFKHGFGKFEPDFSKYFPELILTTLKESTKQDFGSDSVKWKKWIEENVKE